MNCREFIEFLLDYFDGELPADTLALFQEHLRACPPCVDYLASYEQTVKLVRGCACPRDGSAPPEVPEDLVRAILLVRQDTHPT